MVTNLNYFKRFMQTNESSHNWMVCKIPHFSEFKKLQGSPSRERMYEFSSDGQTFVIDHDIDFFKENEGKTVKFKYDPKTRLIHMPKLVKESAQTNSKDIENILLKFCHFLESDGIVLGEDPETLIQKFIYR